MAPNPGIAAAVTALIVSGAELSVAQVIIYEFSVLGNKR